ncbi:MAG: nuclear transport factor 2 family protein [Pseudonocardiales bacterium]|nr:nuclear transport factor 2 family protein [Pseudonocardiales bacterium]
MSSQSLGERFVHGFGTRDWATLEQIYDQDVVLYAPLAWKVVGFGPIRRVVEEFHAAYPGLHVALHDEFHSVDGTRVAFRFLMDWHNTGPFMGHDATGERGTTIETHTVRLREGRIIEQVVGANTMHMKYLEMVRWGMEFPKLTTDPAPAIVSASQDPEPAG